MAKSNVRNIIIFSLASLACYSFARLKSFATDNTATPTLLTPKYYTSDTIVADWIINPSTNKSQDMASTINTALSSCRANGGGTVFLNPGIYRINSPIYVPSMCTLRGDYQDPDNYEGNLEYGTILQVDVNAINYDTNDISNTGLIKLNQSSGAIGLTIHYLNQNLSSIKPQPWSIYYAGGMSYYIKDITFINSYMGIGKSINDKTNHEMLTIQNVKGTVFKEGVLVHNSSDVGTITDLTLSPKYLANANYSALGATSQTDTIDSIKNKIISLDGKGLIITDAEWQEYLNISISGYKYGVYIPDDSVVKTRYMGSGSFYNLNIDNCTIGFMVEGGIYNNGSQNLTMVDYRMGYLISNSSISGSQYSIYTLSKSVNGKIGTIKLNDVSLKGRTGGDGAIIYYNEQLGRYIAVYETTSGGDASGKINNTQKYSNISTKRETKTSGKNFVALPAGSSSETINNALASVGSQGGGVVYLKAGLYTLDSTLVIPANVELRGVLSSPSRLAGLSNGNPSGTVINITSTNSVINLSGDNSGVSGVFITHANNISSLNADATYVTSKYAIISNTTKNVYIKNVTIAGISHGVAIINSSNFVVSNVITGVLKNAFYFDNSTNGVMMNCLQNGTVISRNTLYAFDKTKLLSNIFNANTLDNLQYIFLRNSNNVEIVNSFTYGSWIFLTLYNSSSYSVNTAIDGMNANGIEFYLSSDSKSTMTAINPMRYNGKLYTSGNQASQIGIYNTAYIYPTNDGSTGNIAENDKVKNNNKITWDDTAPILSLTLNQKSNQQIEATITSSEEVQGENGWTLSSDKKHLTKVYTENGIETVAVKDLAGNKKSIDVTITNIKKEIEFDGTIIDKTGGQATITAVATNSFTITSDRACVVLLTQNHGNTYSRLSPSSPSDNTRIYSVSSTSNTEIVVAYAGDVNLDGSVNVRDVRKIINSIVNEEQLTVLEKGIADVDNNDSINVRDARRIVNSITGKTSLTW